MLQELDRLSPGFSASRHHSHPDGDASSETETIDGFSSEPGGLGTVFAPSCIPAYNRPPPPGEEWSSERWKENVLIEYFAGWSVAHAELHRKFIAVATMPDRGYSKWGHVSQPVVGSSSVDRALRLKFYDPRSSWKGNTLK